MTEVSNQDRNSPERLLTEAPFQFDFFQAVRTLHRLAWLSEQGAPVGEDASPEDEVVRFHAWPSHRFPASGQLAFDRPSLDEPPAMTVALMGLTGPSGVLPRHYTQTILDRGRQHDFALRNFLDLFNHRLISLYFRAWEKYRFPLGYERAALDGREEEDLFTQCLYSLLGRGTAGLRGRLEIQDEAFLYYGGPFAQSPANAVTLETIVEDHFQMPTRVLQFEGQWLVLSVEDQTRVTGAYDDEAYNQLGVCAVVGDRVWSVESKFRLRLGPLTYRQFCRMTPAGDRLVPLCQFVRSYVGVELDFDVQLALLAAEVPPCRVAAGDDGARLGWDTWLSSTPFTHDADDATFAYDGRPK